jgi:hypothetical protein
LSSLANGGFLTRAELHGVSLAFPCIKMYRTIFEIDFVGDGSFFIASGVGLSPLYCGHFWSTVPAPDDR